MNINSVCYQKEAKKTLIIKNAFTILISVSLTQVPMFNNGFYYR